MEDEKKDYEEGDIIQGGPWDGFEIISKYSRSDAIQDGTLVDVTEWAKALGIRLPVAITDALWQCWIVPDSQAVGAGENTVDRTRETLGILLVCIRDHKGDTDTIFFDVQFKKDGQRHTVKLKGVCGPGDKGEAVITVMMPDED